MEFEVGCKFQNIYFDLNLPHAKCYVFIPNGTWFAPIPPTIFDQCFVPFTYNNNTEIGKKKRKEKKETINAFGKIVKIVALLNRSTCFTKVQLINIHQSHNFYHTCKHIC